MQSLAYRLEYIHDVQVKKVSNAVISPQRGPQAKHTTTNSPNTLSAEPQPLIKHNYRVQVSLRCTRHDGEHACIHVYDLQH